jgi:hypothetical protein
MTVSLVKIILSFAFPGKLAAITISRFVAMADKEASSTTFPPTGTFGCAFYIDSISSIANETIVERVI